MKRQMQIEVVQAKKDMEEVEDALAVLLNSLELQEEKLEHWEEVGKVAKKLASLYVWKENRIKTEIRPDQPLNITEASKLWGELQEKLVRAFATY